MKLIDMNATETIPILLELLETEEEDMVVANILRILGEFKVEDTLDVILKYAKPKIPFMILSQAIYALGNFEHEKANKALIDLLKEESDEFSKMLLLEAIGKKRIKEAVEPIKEMLNTDDKMRKVDLLITIAKIEGKNSEALKHIY
jgi:HEAT repeat protein